MKSKFKRLMIVAELLLVFVISGCAQTHYSDGTQSGYCIGLSCPIQALMPGALNSGRNPNGDFVRPSPDTLKLGQSTYGQVVELMGNPSTSRTEVDSNGKKLKIITYSYSPATGGETSASGAPVRELTYFFLIPPGGDGGFTSSYTSNRYQLVGQQFSSSLKSDNTNFDDARVNDIIKGKSTLAEVTQQMGVPSASYVSPMVNGQAVEAIEYRHQTPQDAASKPLSKVLRISFDGAGVVSEVNFTTAGNM